MKTKLINSLVYTFILCITLFSCNNETPFLENQKNPDKIEYKYNEDGFDMVFKKIDDTSNKVKSEHIKDDVFYISASKAGVVAEALIIQEKISDSEYVLKHYTINKELIATISVKDNIIEDITLNNAITKSFGSWYKCANKRYKEFMDFYDREHPMLCDLANIVGMCTVAGAVQAMVSC